MHHRREASRAPNNRKHSKTRIKSPKLIKVFLASGLGEQIKVHKIQAHMTKSLPTLDLDQEKTLKQNDTPSMTKMDHLNSKRIPQANTEGTNKNSQRINQTLIVSYKWSATMPRQNRTSKQPHHPSTYPSSMSWQFSKSVKQTTIKALPKRVFWNSLQQELAANRSRRFLWKSTILVM